jgi:hypothetical protein
MTPEENQRQKTIEKLYEEAAKARKLYPQAWTQPRQPPRGDRADGNAAPPHEARKPVPPCQEGALESPPQDARHGQSAQTPNAKNAFPFTMFAEVDANPHKIWLIEDIIGAGEMSSWYGAPGSGKSVAISDAACHVAACHIVATKDWAGKRILQPGAVLYVAAERGGLVKRRIAAWRKHHGIEDVPLAVVDGMVDLRTAKVDANRIIATAKALAEKCGCAVVWIIIDTLNRVLAGGDENGPKDMGRLIGSCDLIQRATGAHVSLVHHVPIDSPDRMRGHSSMLGALDTTIRITKPDGQVLLQVDKENDSVQPARLSFEFKSILLSTDKETGKETTAPVLTPTDVPPAPAGKKSRRLPHSAEIALRALAEAVDEVGEVPPASGHIPANTKVVTVDQWREHAERRGICTSGSDDAKNRRRALNAAFARASETLNSNRHVGIWNNNVWLVRPA